MDGLVCDLPKRQSHILRQWTHFEIDRKSSPWARSPTGLDAGNGGGDLSGCLSVGGNTINHISMVEPGAVGMRAAIPGGDKEWYLHAARAGPPIRSQLTPEFFSLETEINPIAPPTFSFMLAATGAG
jgi:hypothetical protein